MVKIIPDDGQRRIFSGNRCVGYVDEETNILYGFDKDGYAVEIGGITDSISIGAMYLDWKNRQK